MFCFVSPHLLRSLVFPADDFSSQDNLDDPEAGGWDATLVAEEEEEFFELQIVKHHDSEVSRDADRYFSSGVFFCSVYVFRCENSASKTAYKGCNTSVYYTSHINVSYMTDCVLRDY